ncbi:putative ribosomal protein L13e [Helianthus debilis subsp. tardiflorus]
MFCGTKSCIPLLQHEAMQYYVTILTHEVLNLAYFIRSRVAAGIPKKLAPTIGIAVDHRRRNRSLEGLQANVQRLKTFKAKLVIFPRRTRKTKAGDSTPEELATATQVQGPVLPIIREKPAVELVKVTEEMKSFNAYAKLRVERTNKRHLGARLKRAADAEKEEKK